MRFRSTIRRPILGAVVGIVVLTLSCCSAPVGVQNQCPPQTVTGIPSPSGPGTPNSVPAALLIPPSGALWGAWVSPVNGQTDAQAVAGLEALMGRPLAIVHQYHAWDDVWPTATELTWAAGGRILFADISVRRDSGSALRWSAVANGSQDANIDALAGRLRSYGSQLMISFEEEPENRFHANPTAYSLASFVAAYRHLHDRLAADGVSNVVWVWNVTGYSGNQSIYPRLYPGDSYVDWIAWDPYNWYNCPVNTTNTWTSFASLVGPFYSWIAKGSLSPRSAAKPLMLAEYGTVEHRTSPSKGQWFTDEVKSLADLPALKAVVYFDENKDCNWPITTSATSIAGFRAAGLSCYLYPEACAASLPSSQTPTPSTPIGATAQAPGECPSPSPRST